MNKNLFIFFLFLLFSVWSALLVAQEPPTSIFDEGVDTTIRAEDIGDDVRMWAQNTALKLTKALEDIKSLSIPEKKEALVSVIQESVTEAKDKRELLLMRFMLNRALKLNEFYQNQSDALVLNYVLLPAVKKAILLYEESDLPFLEANKDKPESEIKPPAYAAFTKNTIDYLLTASNMNKTLEGQFNILKSSIVWIANDLLHSSETKRNPINARLILNLQEKGEELKTISSPTYQINNSIRKLILKTKNEIVVETPPPPKACADASVNLRNAPIGFKCITSANVIFERAEKEGFGEAWKDLQTGLIWSDRNSSEQCLNVIDEIKDGIILHSVATRICEKMGGTVPTASDFKIAETHGFREALPHMKDHQYWSSSVHLNNADQDLFNGEDGRLYTINPSIFDFFFVRCVAQ
ncbi:MAG TPA: hypothetical protein DD708_01640 [Deltaproteobacteria bacterium]|nr:hypothetical protein [Deltaproteobacteria bacterium]